MYIPKLYKCDDPELVKSFLKKYSFAILINNLDGRIWATHIPLELEEKEDGRFVLQGHIAKSNPQWKSFDEQGEVLCIFNGPHSYISSSWYDYEEVPTWNYIAVHVYGKLQPLEGDKLYEHLKSLVNKYEARQKHAVDLDTMSSKTKSQIRGIVGFEIEISEIHAATKLSQNKSEINHSSIIQHLEASDDASATMIAEEMKRSKKNKD